MICLAKHSKTSLTEQNISHNTLTKQLVNSEKKFLNYYLLTIVQEHYKLMLGTKNILKAIELYKIE